MGDFWVVERCRMIIYRARIIRCIIGWFFKKQWVLERADNSDYVAETCFVNYFLDTNVYPSKGAFLVLEGQHVTLEKGVLALTSPHEGRGRWTETEHWRLRNVFTDEVIPEEILCR